MKDLPITMLVCLVCVYALVHSGDSTEKLDVSWRVVFRTIGFKTVGKTGKASIQIIGRGSTTTKQYDLAVGRGVTSHSIGTNYIGEPTHVKVRFLDQSNSWNLQQVEISRTDNVYHKYIFPCWCWLTNYDTNTLPVSRPMWLVTVFTSNKKGVYTDRVWVKMIGTQDVSRKINIDDNNFRAGRKVSRVLYTKVIGIPTRIEVGPELGYKIITDHRNDAYHLNKIEIERGDILSKTKYVFNCNCTIRKNSNRTIYLANPRWRVSVKTPDYNEHSKNGVDIKLVGTAGNSSVFWLNSPKRKHFEKNSWDHFEKSTTVIGEIEGVMARAWRNGWWNLFLVQLELKGSFDKVVVFGFWGSLKGKWVYMHRLE